MANKPKVAVVDDSALVLAWVAAALADEWEVVGITSPVEAAARIYVEKPDLVLIDCNMPVLTGDSIVKLTRDNRAAGRVPVVLFSGLPPDELARRAAACGADGFIEKTSDPQELLAAVNRYHTFEASGAAREQGGSSVVGSSSRVSDDAPASATARLERESRISMQAAQRDFIWAAGVQAFLPTVAAMLHGRFNIVSFDTGKQVCDALAVEKPSLLLLGAQLADTPVAELCRTIRANAARQRVSILFLGSSTDQGLADRVVAAGANRALVQPFDGSSFFDAVGRLTTVAVRRHARLMVRIEVNLRQHGTFSIGFSRDLSASGMFLDSDLRPSLNDRLRLRFFIPGRSKDVDTEARVVRLEHRTSQGFAVEFLGLSDEEKAAIAAFVKSRG